MSEPLWPLGNPLDATDPARYDSIETRIAALTEQRDVIATQIKSQLDAAAFAGQPLDQDVTNREIDLAQNLIDAASELASS